MNILGVPSGKFSLNLAITVLITAAIFMPALLSFGSLLFGTEDIKFFLWDFWHFDSSIRAGSDPFFSTETFFPYGISLAFFTTSVFSSLIFWALPASWGAFGKVTFLQALSFVLGGAFSFALAYRFTKSFLPSLVGNVVFNFSVYHFEKSLHHLNYSMAFPFLALFFLFFFELPERPRERKLLGLLSLSLLLIALNELTVAVMAGFIVFLLIFVRYLNQSSITLSTPRNAVILCSAVFLSLIANHVLAYSPVPMLAYLLPPGIFLCACVFLIGPANLQKREKESGFLASMALGSIPAIAFIAFLALYPSVPFVQDSALTNDLLYGVGIENLIIPTGFQAISNTGILGNPRTLSETGVFLGPIIALLFLASFIVAGASKEEESARDFSILCVLFSFPVISIGSFAIFSTPFFAQPLFPLLQVLRAPSRFMLFALLFISVMSGLLVQRLSSLFPGRKGALLALALACSLLALQWPAMEKFVFNDKAPAFYERLQVPAAGTQASVFLYPGMDYWTLLDDMYFQTLYNNSLSYMAMSREPLPTNPLLSLYYYSTRGNLTTDIAADFAESAGYDYVLFHKTRCGADCFMGEKAPLDTAYRSSVESGLAARFGAPVYEDGGIAVYAVSARAGSQAPAKPS